VARQFPQHKEARLLQFPVKDDVNLMVIINSIVARWLLNLPLIPKMLLGAEENVL